jgi:hypothetical protein
MSIITDCDEFKKYKWLAVYATAFVVERERYTAAYRKNPSLAHLRSIREQAMLVANEESES